jgi:methionyl-tRNA formyltransferase
MKKSEVKLVAEEYKLKIFEPEKFAADVVSEIKDQKPDLIVVAAYGKILPTSVLEIPGFGALNVHASLLPKFRGPSPVQNAILEGETETGTTVMLMDQGIDSGNILAQKKIAIAPDETYPDLLEKIAGVSADFLLEIIPLWVERRIKPKEQDKSQATYCQLIERADGKIIWSEDALAIFDRWRAFYPWPGVFTYWEKGGYNLRLKIHKMSLAKDNTGPSLSSGEVFEFEGKLAVKTGRGVLVLEEIQLEGKPKMESSAFKNGYPDFLGAILK